VHPELALAGSLAADVHHPGALVEPGDVRPAADELGGVQAGTAGRVEDAFACDVAQQRQAGRPVVVSVEEPVFRVLEEFVGE
jgi:hypothetical protein